MGANPLAFGDATQPGGKVVHEKLLFCRGLDHFQAPLQTVLNAGQEQHSLRDTGQAPLTDLFVLWVRQDRAKFNYYPSLDAGAGQGIVLEPKLQLRTVSEGAKQWSGQVERF